MARIRTSQPQSREPETWQQKIVERIKKGKLVPILSSTIDDDLVLGGHMALVHKSVNNSSLTARSVNRRRCGRKPGGSRIRREQVNRRVIYANLY